MKYINSTITYFVAAFVCIAMVSGCLDANESQYASTVQFGMQVNNFDSTLVSGEDSISVDRFRFVYGDGSIGLNDTTAALFRDEGNWQEFGVTQNSNNPFALFSNQGYAIRFPSGTYDNLVLSVQKAPTGNSNIDSDFTGAKRYTMIIDGTYNGDDFTFMSERTFKKTLTIAPPVQVPQYNGQYLFLVKTDVQMWFAKPSGGFYDPSDTTNSSTINDRVEGSFTIETQSSQ